MGGYSRVDMSSRRRQLLKAFTRSAGGGGQGDGPEDSSLSPSAAVVTTLRDAASAAAARAIQEAEPRRATANVDWRASERYERLWRGSERHVQQLRVVLQSAEASSKERAWLRLKPVGDLDETRLVDAAIGERHVFKQRGVPPARLGAHQTKPKHMAFLLDASASMSRGDSFDGRLQRMAQVVGCCPATGHQWLSATSANGRRSLIYDH